MEKDKRLEKDLKPQKATKLEVLEPVASEKRADRRAEDDNSTPQKQRSWPKDGLLSLQNKRVLAGAVFVLGAMAVLGSMLPVSDQVPESEINQIVEQSNSILAQQKQSARSMFHVLSGSEVRQAIDAGLFVAKDGSGERTVERFAGGADLEKDLKDGAISAVIVTVWDNYQEDGDVISISNLGVEYTIPILNAPTSVIVPVALGDDPNVMLRAITDGGGGVTVAASTQFGELPIPPMAVGSSVSIPIR